MLGANPHSSPTEPRERDASPAPGPRPRILYICSSWPQRHGFGGQLRAWHIGRVLKRVGDVTLLVVSSDAGDEKARQTSAADFDVAPPVQPQLSPNRGLAQKMRWALDTRYMNLHGYVAPAAERDRVVALAARSDLVWVLNARTPNILQHWHWPHAHLDLDDVPSTYLRTVVQNGTGGMRQLKARAQQFLLHRRERRFAQRFTTLSVCSEEDRNYLGGGREIHVIPNGFERPAVAPARAPATQPPRIGFIGLYSYAPNLDGVRWFLRECWPALRQAVPGIRFRLVGKDTAGELKPTEPDVDALGWVNDPAAEIATWSATVIPIRFGGGTRIKLADAFSRKCPVIATRLGAFGYAVEDGRQLRLADTPRDFTQACLDVIRDRPGAEAMAERAWNDFLEKWTWDAIAPRIRATAEDCLRRSAPAG